MGSMVGYGGVWLGMEGYGGGMAGKPEGRHMPIPGMSPVPIRPKRPNRRPRPCGTGALSTPKCVSRPGIPGRFGAI